MYDHCENLCFLRLLLLEQSFVIVVHQEGVQLELKC